MTADDDEPFDPETHNRYRLQRFTLAGQTVTLYLPYDWILREEDYFTARFSVPWVDGARLSVKLVSYEAPDEIARNEVGHFLSGEGLPLLEVGPENMGEDGAIDWETPTQHVTGTLSPGKKGERRELYWGWRRIGLLKPTNVRTLAVDFFAPADEPDSERLEETTRLLARLVPLAEFTEREMPADRVAPSETLRRERFWGVICLRVPSDWPRAERENPDGTGMYVIDDKEADRWTLWIDYRQQSYQKGARLDQLRDAWAKEIVDEAHSTEGTVHAAIVPLPGRPGATAAKVEAEVVEDGVLLRYITWHRVAFFESRMIVAHFAWVVPVRVLDDPDIRALTTVVEREALNALILDPGDRPK